MARVFLTSIDLSGNELLNAVAQNLTSDPVGKPDGHFFYDTNLSLFRFKQGGSYVSLGSGGGDVTGPASSTDGNLVSFNGTSGKTIQDSGIAAASLVTAGSTTTFTNKTFDANGTGNSISNIEVADLATAAKTGSDTKVVTGTAGTNGNVGQWNGDGDLVDGGVSISNISSAISASHTQNTDTGTTAASFQIASGASGPRIKNSGGEVQLRNAADNAFADLRVANLYVEGGTTVIVSNTMEIGDSEALFNQDITTAAGNSDGGLAIKRLDTDNTTRRDAKLIFNESTDRWQATWGPHTAAVLTHDLGMVKAFDVGNGVDTDIPLTHNFKTRDVSVQLYLNSGTYEQQECDVKRNTVDQVTLSFATAPDSGAYRAVVTA